MSRRGRCWLLSLWLPAVLVTLPLVGGFASRDERIRVWSRTLRVGASPLDVVADNWRGTAAYLELGHFRPLGRFVETWVHVMAYEVGELAAVPPHVVLGVVRAAMVALLAVAVAAMVAALARDVGIDGALAARWYALVFAAVLISGGTGALTQFPQTMIGAVVLVCVAALVISRDRDMTSRRLRWPEVVAMAALGVVCALYYDIAFAALPVAAAFLVARGVGSGTPWRELCRLAATRRLAVYGAGFAVAFGVSRVLIAISPAKPTGRYVGVDPRFGLDALGAAVQRLAVGLPWQGWARGTDRGRWSGLNPEDLVSDPAAAVVSVALAVLLIVAWARLRRTAVVASPSDLRRLAAALGVTGVAVALSGAVIAGLALRIQDGGGAWTWRETLLVQLGWALIAAAVAALALSAVRGRGARRAAAAAGAAVLAAALPLALLSNWRVAEADRRAADHAAISLVSAAAMHPADDIDLGVVRCNLAAAWAATAPPSSWHQPLSIIEDIDRLWLDRYGIPFCDRDGADS